MIGIPRAAIIRHKTQLQTRNARQAIRIAAFLPQKDYASKRAQHRAAGPGRDHRASDYARFRFRCRPSFREALPDACGGGLPSNAGY